MFAYIDIVIRVKRILPVLLPIAMLAMACSSEPATTAPTTEVDSTATAAPGPPEPSSTVETETDPALVTVPCFDAPGLTDGVDVRCATVTVPMRNGTDATADLFVTVIGSERVLASDPIVHVPGGPGAGAEAYAPILADTYLALSAAAAQPIVFVDPRGSGASTPFLTCDDPTDPAACAAAWTADGIDPLAISTVNAADDIADVAVALGASQIDLWGASYGSRLALEVTRRHEDLVRSVTLESVDTADSMLDDGADVRAAVGRIAADCTADAVCSAALPDLVATVDTTAAKLQTTPLESQFGTFDGAAFVSTLTGLMEASVGTTYVPALVAAAGDGDVGTIDALQSLLAAEPSPGGSFSVGMQSVVNCGDAAPYDPAEVITATAFDETDAIGPSRLAEIDALYASGCDVWPHATDGPTELVSSDVPTLILSGNDDSNTPLENAELAASALPNSTLVTFPSTGHFPMHRGGNACAESIFVAFIADPSATVDASCVPDPQLVTALPFASEVTFENTTIDDLGLSADLPTGWIMVGPAVRVTRDASLSVSLVPSSVDEAVPAVVEQFGATEVVTTPMDVNGTTWQRVTATSSGSSLRIAATSAGDQTLLVAVAGPLDARSVDALFDRIVASITPI